MDRIDRLLRNRSLWRILLTAGCLLLLGAVACYALATRLAETLTQQQIHAMLAYAGGGKFTELPDEQMIAAGESITGQIGINRDLPPHLMMQYPHVKAMLFWVMYGVLALAVLIVSGVAYASADAQIRELEQLSAECIRLADHTEGYCKAIGTEQSAVRRACDSVNHLLFQLRRRREHLKRKEHTLKEFLTRFSHQLKTSLAVVRLNEDMLNELDLPEEQRLRLTDEINLHLDGMEELVLDSLKLTRLEAEAIAYQMAEKNLADTLETAVERMAPLCREKGVAVQLQYDNKVQYDFWHDKLWLREAIENIMKNAVDHAECSEIVVELQRIPGAYKLTLTDNGKGVTQHEIARMFRPFRKQAGLQMKNAGVGLQIAKRIIHAHQGDISVYRTADGGTQFVILFLKLDRQEN